MMTRSERRALAERKKKRAEDYFGGYEWPNTPNDKRVGRNARTPRPCSCMVCKRYGGEPAHTNKNVRRRAKHEIEDQLLDEPYDDE